ncbi:MAG: fatty acid desaturase, partial [Myxococcota bacterium]|nr:fatty acid desaturase [Myxococcota bacterium]
MLTATDFRQLHDELDAQGAFHAPALRSWTKMFVCNGIAVAISTWVLFSPSSWSLLALAPASLFLGAGVMMGHEGGHHSACNSRRQNNLMIHLAFGVVAGISSIFWKYKHNVLHHRNPNDPSKDRDLLLGPVAVTKEQYDRSPAALQWFQRHMQHYSVWILSGFLGPLMRIRSFVAMTEHLRTKGADRVFWSDFSCVSLHYVLWLVLPSLYVSFLWALLVYFLVFFGVGVMLGIIFLPGHTGMPLVDTATDQWSQQILTSRSITLSRPVSFFWVGLENQLEHHLFPRLSHTKMRQVKPTVRRWAESHGFELDEDDFFPTFARVVAHLHTAAWTDVPI